VLCVQNKEMKQAWCLAASSTSATSKALMRLYGKRWGIECGLRDTRDPRFGMGLGSIHVSTPERRDRLWLLNAFAVALLTLLGAAGEVLSYDRYLKSNTTKRRTHSLFRQGCMLYELIPTMPEVRLLPLIARFATMRFSAGAGWPRCPRQAWTKAAPEPFRASARSRRQGAQHRCHPGDDARRGLT